MSAVRPGPAISRDESAASERLTALLSIGRRRGFLYASEVESALLEASPDASEFDLFLELLQPLGIGLREGSPEAKPVRARKGVVPGQATGPPARRTTRRRGYSQPGLPPSGTALDALSLYLRDVARYRVLEPAEERALAVLAREGDERCREHLIVANLRLVITLVRRFLGRGVSIEDLIEEGNLGLITATERFDPERGFRFSTYASWWIRQAMARCVAEQSRSVKVPLHAMRSVYAYLESERRLRARLHRSPTHAEVCRAAGFGERKGRTVARLVEGIKSLDERLAGSAARDLTLLERIPSRGSLEDLVLTQLEYEHLASLLDSLSPREQLVIRIRYGFLDGEGHSLRETGLFLHLSGERVRQIEQAALARLRAWILEEEGT